MYDAFWHGCFNHDMRPRDMENENAQRKNRVTIRTGALNARGAAMPSIIYVEAARLDRLYFS